MFKKILIILLGLFCFSTVHATIIDVRIMQCGNTAFVLCGDHHFGDDAMSVYQAGLLTLAASLTPYPSRIIIEKDAIESHADAGKYLPPLTKSIADTIQYKFFSNMGHEKEMAALVKSSNVYEDLFHKSKKLVDLECDVSVFHLFDAVYTKLRKDYPVDHKIPAIEYGDMRTTYETFMNLLDGVFKPETDAWRLSLSLSEITLEDLKEEQELVSTYCKNICNQFQSNQNLKNGLSHWFRESCKQFSNFAACLATLDDANAVFKKQLIKSNGDNFFQNNGDITAKSFFELAYSKHQLFIKTLSQQDQTIFMTNRDVLIKMIKYSYKCAMDCLVELYSGVSLCADITLARKQGQAGPLKKIFVVTGKQHTDQLAKILKVLGCQEIYRRLVDPVDIDAGDGDLDDLFDDVNQALIMPSCMLSELMHH